MHKIIKKIITNAGTTGPFDVITSESSVYYFIRSQKACKVAVVSTYLPKNCGLATFTAALLARLREHPELPAGCEIGVIALSDPSDRHVYTDPIVHYDLRVDSVSASSRLPIMQSNNYSPEPNKPVALPRDRIL